MADYPPSSEGGSVEALRPLGRVMKFSNYPPSSEGGSVEAGGRTMSHRVRSQLSALLGGRLR